MLYSVRQTDLPRRHAGGMLMLSRWFARQAKQFPCLGQSLVQGQFCSINGLAGAFGSSGTGEETISARQ